MTIASDFCSKTGYASREVADSSGAMLAKETRMLIFGNSVAVLAPWDNAASPPCDIAE